MLRSEAPLARMAVAALICGAAVVLFASGCAFRVDMSPARLEPTRSGTAFIRIDQAATIKLATGYERVLPAGGRWQHVGTLPQGDVYSPVGTVFSIEGRDVHEAYIVIKDQQLRGFFLPAESTYSPLANTIRISTGGTQ